MTHLARFPKSCSPLLCRIRIPDHFRPRRRIDFGRHCDPAPRAARQKGSETRYRLNRWKRLKGDVVAYGGLELPVWSALRRLSRGVVLAQTYPCA